MYKSIKPHILRQFFGCIYIFFIVMFVLLGMMSCQENNKDPTDLLALFQKEKMLNCQLELMKDSITNEWDQVNQLLEENLPADMPEVEKNNMLKVRNASLIRMFQSFEQVDEEVKIALQEAEMKDMAMTKRIIALKAKISEIEAKKLQLFEKINREVGQNELANYQAKREGVMLEDCGKATRK